MLPSAAIRFPAERRGLPRDTGYGVSPARRSDGARRVSVFPGRRLTRPGSCFPPAPCLRSMDRVCLRASTSSSPHCRRWAVPLARAFPRHRPSRTPPCRSLLRRRVFGRFRAREAKRENARTPLLPAERGPYKPLPAVFQDLFRPAPASSPYARHIAGIQAGGGPLRRHCLHAQRKAPPPAGGPDPAERPGRILGQGVRKEGNGSPPGSAPLEARSRGEEENVAARPLPGGCGNGRRRSARAGREAHRGSAATAGNAAQQRPVSGVPRSMHDFRGLPTPRTRPPPLPGAPCAPSGNRL